MLFSEPKIPQCACSLRAIRKPNGFSALQRAENSSIEHVHEPRVIRHVFQCSSASRKFLNAPVPADRRCARRGFSALQRAENSSIYAVLSRASFHRVSVLFSEPKIPQSQCFRQFAAAVGVSVLFSEPKIPQFAVVSVVTAYVPQQFQCSSASRKFLNFQAVAGDSLTKAFQCSSASRKFLNKYLWSVR